MTNRRPHVVRAHTREGGRVQVRQHVRGGGGKPASIREIEKHGKIPKNLLHRLLNLAEIPWVFFLERSNGYEARTAIARALGDYALSEVAIQAYLKVMEEYAKVKNPVDPKIAAAYMSGVVAASVVNGFREGLAEGSGQPPPKPINPAVVGYGTAIAATGVKAAIRAKTSPHLVPTTIAEGASTIGLMAVAMNSSNIGANLGEQVDRRIPQIVRNAAAPIQETTRRINRLRNIANSNGINNSTVNNMDIRRIGRGIQTINNNVADSIFRSGFVRRNLPRYYTPYVMGEKPRP